MRTELAGTKLSIAVVGVCKISKGVLSLLTNCPNAPISIFEKPPRHVKRRAQTSMYDSKEELN